MKLKLAVGVVAAAVLAGTANGACFDEMTERLNEGPLDFTTKSSDEVAFRFMSEWAKQYKQCLPLDVGDFKMLDIVPKLDRAVVYVFEYAGKEELVPDDSSHREIWLSMHRTYCKEGMLSARGVRLVYSIRDRLGVEMMRVEVFPDACRVEQA